MRSAYVEVPSSLLADPALTPCVKVVWMALRLNSQTGESSRLSVSRLAERIGISRDTVRSSLAQLAAVGWRHWESEAWAQRLVQARRDRASPLVWIPADLVFDRSVDTRGRVLYGLLQRLPDFRHPSGRFRASDLGRRLHVQPATVQRAAQSLTRRGWLHMEQANQLAPIRFTLRNPIVDRNLGALKEVQRRLERATYRGEALMRAYLDLIVASDQFEDDAAPGFLVNPQSRERLQFDRFYPPRVAFEFNGSQHYVATERFSDDVVREQRARDLMKRGICAERNVTLVVIHPEDLNLESMRARVGRLLPVRELSGQRQVIAYLDAAGRRYARSVPDRPTGVNGPE